ncbi:unnamed protein product [Lathyrus oleraceus]|uniref:SCR-like protein n=1 Tax=Pisum sativum TaxID=3888 RepID=A0A9D4Y6K8_PEA|nr:uncharacterized protein LOC127128430 [Pisum sativum]KAI5431845.1 hypothetical protein KIW84_035843 [Pisum sativum]
MKPGRIILLLVALFALFSLTYGSGQEEPNIKFCPRLLKGLSGDCLHAQRDCNDEFNARYKGAQARRCRCDTTANTHTCSCCIVCGLNEHENDFPFVSKDDFIPEC